jgi:hypothetical protein
MSLLSADTARRRWSCGPGRAATYQLRFTCDKSTLLLGHPGTIVDGHNTYPDGTLDQFQPPRADLGRHRMPLHNQAIAATTSGAVSNTPAGARLLLGPCTNNCRGYYTYDLGAWHCRLVKSP